MSSELTVCLDGGWFPQMFLVVFPQGPRGLINIFLCTDNGSTLVTAYYPILHFLGVLVLGPNQHFLEGTLSLEVSLYSILGTYGFDAFPEALNIWDYYMSYTVFPLAGFVTWPLLLEVLVPCVVVLTWVLLLPFPSQLPLITLFCILWIAHLGYVHLTKASLRSCNSSLRRSGVVQTVLALWVSEPITLYLAEWLWWLSHCKYWSVWVGLWHTFMLRELSASGLTKVSRKGIAPFCWLPSKVTFYCWIYTVNMVQKKLLLGLLLDDPCVIHKLNQYLEGLEAVLRASLSKCSIYRLATIGLISNPIATPSTCSKNLSWKEVCIMQTEP